jgi:TolB-like protein/ketosteroid isomerase-like protein
MSDIFLSYAAEDRDRTRPLVQALESCGWSVWWDRTILPSERWEDVIEKALGGARCLLVVWSKMSVTSDWVKNEVEEAKSLGKVIFPVLVDDVKPPFAYRHIQAARLIAWRGNQDDEEFRKLALVMTEKLGTGQGPPDIPGNGGGRVRRRRLVLGGLAAAIVLALVFGVIRIVLPPKPLVIGVMEIEGRGNVPPWVCNSTREGLNTILSKVVKVYSRDVIDLLRKKRGMTNTEAAEKLGITKVITGSISESGHGLVLAIEIDAADGMIDTAEEIPGSEQRLIEMQNNAAKAVLRVIKPDFGQEAFQKLVANRTNDQLEGLKLLAETMGDVVDEKEKPPPPPPPRGQETSWDIDWPAAAFAADPGEGEVKDLLERYRVALEAKSMDQIAKVYVEITPGMRDALARYFETADQLKVRFSNYDIFVEGNEAVATFTRDDDFKDARSGRDMHLEVRISSVVAKQDGGWRIRGLKKPS